MVDKLKMQTPNITDQNIEQILKLFPNVRSEATDENGNTKSAIDFSLLKQALSEVLVDDSDERYRLDWPGKKASLLKANTPITKTLRPCREDSVNFDTTENIYLEGDNFEVLKILQESYLGKIKMIYIDPPYNTGGDFIYKDNFTAKKVDYEEELGATDEDDNKLFKNTDSNGRFHSDWLSMMYERLLVARDLLRNDGVVFVHIDDNEVESLGKLCNEVFGEENFINIVTVKTKVGGVSGSSEGKSLKDATEFIWIYAKSKESLLLNPVYIKTKLSDRIRSYEDEGKSWKYTSVIVELDGKVLIKEDTSRNRRYYGYKTLETMSLQAFARSKSITEEEAYNEYADRIFRTTNAQSSVRQTVIKETEGIDYPMYGCEYVPIKGKNEGSLIEVLYKSGATSNQRNMVMLLSDVVEKADGIYYYMDKVSSLWDDIDYNNLTKEGDTEFSNGKKPIKLIQRMLSLVTEKDSLVMDFFSGSGSTAHAVMHLNAEDNGNRRFIMVQLPEETGEKSEAYKAGYKTIAEIGKERIRRAGKKFIEANQDKEGIENLDIGFRVFKTDTTNMKDVYYHPELLNQQDLLSKLDNIKEGRTSDDLLTQVILDLGLELNLPIENRGILGNTVYIVQTNALVACFDDNINFEIVDEIAKLVPFKVIFKDASFKDDKDRINVEERFKHLSPETKVTVL